MARQRTCRSPCRNPSPGGKDKGGPSGALTKGSNTPTHFLAISRAPTPALLSTNELFKRFIKAYLESNQGPSQPLEERERPLKAKVPDVYYGKLYMNCYRFCQQCENHFETSRTTKTNRTPFAASFLCRNISVRWTQFKCYWDEKIALITWAKFKAFLWKNLGEFKSFIDSIWKKLKKDSRY